MNQVLTAETISGMMKKSLEAINQDDIAFLFATGKNELLLRDLLASFMHRTLNLEGNEFIAREWKKHDLAIVDGLEPIALIEGKSWIHYDAANPVKLLGGKNSVKDAMVKDIEKMRRNLEQHPMAKAFITNVLFSIDVSDDFPLEFGHLTYGHYHRQGARRFGSFDALLSQGRENLREFLGKYGQVSGETILAGTYSGMALGLDFFVLEVA